MLEKALKRSVWYDYLKSINQTVYLTLKYRVMTQKTKLIVGIIGAAAAGVAIGMLLAPDSGNNTRRTIGRTAGNWASTVGDLLETAKGQISSVASKAKTNGNRAVNRADDFL
jgi:gas vesicle protein